MAQPSLAFNSSFSARPVAYGRPASAGATRGPIDNTATLESVDTPWASIAAKSRGRAVPFCQDRRGLSQPPPSLPDSRHLALMLPADCGDCISRIRSPDRRRVGVTGIPPASRIEACGLQTCRVSYPAPRKHLCGHSLTLCGLEDWKDFINVTAGVPVAFPWKVGASVIGM